MDKVLESLIAFPDFDSTSIEASFDRVLASKSTASDQNDFIQRILKLSSVLLEAANNAHNALAWPLPLDLTIKVFSMMDTRSACCFESTCKFSRKCTMDPRCLVNIDLVTSVPKYNDALVSKMIHRAGNELQSVKLGTLSRNNMRGVNVAAILTPSCVSSLKENDGAVGSKLRRLHLYNIQGMDDAKILGLLSVCPSLVDLTLVGLRIGLKNTMESLSIYCHLLERLTFETFYSDSGNFLGATLHEFMLNCPNITNLALNGYTICDDYAEILVKVLNIDLTKNPLTGSFLKDIGTNGGGNRLKAIILRDCTSLLKVEVEMFTKCLLAGDLRLLRHLDISNKHGLKTDGSWLNRCFNISFLPIEKLLEQRPGFRLVAEFPDKTK